MAKAEKKETVEDSTEETPKAEEPQKIVESDQGQTMEMTDQTRADMERAIAASQSRLEAPQVSVTPRENPLKDFIAAFAPETVGRDAQWHAYTDAPKNHNVNISKGYIPVIDPTTKRQAVTPDGDWLYKLPMELYRRGLKMVTDRSDSILSKSRKSKRTVEDDDGVLGRVEEEITIEKAALV